MEVDGARRRGCQARRAVVGIAVLDPRGELVGERGFEAGADRPAGLELRVGAAGVAGLDAAHGETAGAVEQEAVEGEAGAGAERGAPRIAHGETGAIGALLAAGKNVAFDAEQEVARRREIVAGVEAAEEALRLRGGRRRTDIGRAPVVAAEQAGIGPGPAEGGRRAID